jgi:glycosyltransferase involved in cell wall biosynthesis
MMESQSNSLSLSILIPTYGRDHVLIDTISALLALPPPGPNEIVILDQSSHHSEECEAQLSRWHQSQKIRLMRLPTPSITIAMNLGLVVAKSTRVVFSAPISGSSISKIIDCWTCLATLASWRIRPREFTLLL